MKKVFKTSWHTSAPLNGRKSGLVAAAVEVQRLKEEPPYHDRPEIANQEIFFWINWQQNI